MGIEEELEKQIIRNAKKQAEKILMDAQKSADATYTSSLEYVDDMLSELNLVTLRAKESMKNLMQELLEQFDKEIDMIHQNKQEILEDLRDMSDHKQERTSRAKFDIKINESYFIKRPYDVKLSENGHETSEIHKAAKQSFEIKVAEEWRERIEQLSKEREIAEEEMGEPPETEPPRIMLTEKEDLFEETKTGVDAGTLEETEAGYHPDDFNLDAEYFNWLKENREEEEEPKGKVGIWKIRKRRKKKQE